MICLSKASKIKILFKEFHISVIWGQNVGFDWVKNCKKGYFHPRHLTLNPGFPKKEVLKSHSLLTH